MYFSPLPLLFIVHPVASSSRDLTAWHTAIRQLIVKLYCTHHVFVRCVVSGLRHLRLVTGLTTSCQPSTNLSLLRSVTFSLILTGLRLGFVEKKTWIQIFVHRSISIFEYFVLLYTVFYLLYRSELYNYCIYVHVVYVVWYSPTSWWWLMRQMNKCLESLLSLMFYSISSVSSLELQQLKVFNTCYLSSADWLITFSN